MFLLIKITLYINNYSKKNKKKKFLNIYYLYILLNYFNIFPYHL